MIQNLIFNWTKNGENNGANILEVSVCGHTGRIFKSLDNNKWTAKIDHKGLRAISTEEEAKKFVETTIHNKILIRYQKAQSDLALFQKSGLVFEE